MLKRGTLAFHSYSTVFSQAVGFTLCTDPVLGRVGFTQCSCRAPVPHFMVLLGYCACFPAYHHYGPAKRAARTTDALCLTDPASSSWHGSELNKTTVPQIHFRTWIKSNLVFLSICIGYSYLRKSEPHLGNKALIPHGFFIFASTSLSPFIFISFYDVIARTLHNWGMHPACDEGVNLITQGWIYTGTYKMISSLSAFLTFDVIFSLILFLISYFSLWKYCVFINILNITILLLHITVHKMCTISVQCFLCGCFFCLFV